MNLTNSNGLAAANNQPAKTYNQHTNDLDFHTGQRQRKEESTLMARLALAGHVVHRGRCTDYTVCKWGLTYYAQDISDLAAFAIRLGVTHAQ